MRVLLKDLIFKGLRIFMWLKTFVGGQVADIDISGFCPGQPTISTLEIVQGHKTFREFVVAVMALDREPGSRLFEESSVQVFVKAGPFAECAKDISGGVMLLCSTYSEIIVFKFDSSDRLLDNPYP